LTGRRLFEGESVADTLSQVLTKEPDWAALPSNTPAAIRQLLGRCLTKDPRSRLDSAVAARLDIDDALASPGAVGPAPSHSRTSSARLAIPAMALVALLAAVVTWFVTRADPPAPVRRVLFPFVPTADVALSFDVLGSGLQLSPDGRYLAYTGAGGRIMLRALDEVAARPLPGVTGAGGPFFSPDSQWIGFFVQNEMKKMPVTGGSITTICRGLDAPARASWGEDQRIVFSSADGSGLRIVSADGGEPTLLPTRAESRGLQFTHPLTLPGKRVVLFTIWSGTEKDSEIALLDLQTHEQRTVLRGGFHPRYVNPGYLVYEASRTLLAVRFDVDRLAIRGKPVAIGPDIRLGKPLDSPWSGYTTSLDGTVAFIPEVPIPQNRLLVWVDRKGVETAIPAQPRAYGSLRLSPDGTRLAVSVYGGDRDIWMWDFARETLTRVTSGRSMDDVPVWTPDGRHIVFQSDRDGSAHLYRQSADGSGEAERLTEGTSEYWPNSITADGAALLGAEPRPGLLYDIVKFPLHPPSGSSPAGRPAREVVLSSARSEYAANISPDGRYFVYFEQTPVSAEVVVRPYPNANERRWQISADGGTEGVWARDMRELFYRDRATRSIIAVPIDVSGSTLMVGKAQRLIDRAYWGDFYHYDLSPKGDRFLMIKEGDRQPEQPRPIVFLMNWTESLTSP
jgi:serine/threonine-protein kinase